MYPRELDREDAVTSGHHENGMDVGSCSMRGRLELFKLKGGKCCRRVERKGVGKFSAHPILNHTESCKVCR